jgi:hypothetical protein
LGAAAGPKPAADASLSPAQAMSDVVRIRHGKHLTEEQLTLIKQSIENSLRAAERMKQWKLQNGDEPAFTFSADLP